VNAGGRVSSSLPILSMNSIHALLSNAQIPNASVISLSSMNGSNGFRLDGVSKEDESGISVNSAGDFNGDGYDDVIIGAVATDWNGVTSGSSYIVFGKSTIFDATINLSTLDGNNGFRLDGLKALDQSGKVVNYAGDINNDGFSDLIVGAPEGSNNGNQSGSAYIIFGKPNNISSVINLSGLSGSDGFRVDGSASDELGCSVSSAGDVNGDGFDDIIIGAHIFGTQSYINYSGASYVIFGSSGWSNSLLNLSSLNGS
ncbi:MAG: FG-GAP repeat protein, partial [Magnetococcales bacterium]|nr:FG-GAP repeat protein [Magnetococcales bacterium]